MVRVYVTALLVLTHVIFAVHGQERQECSYILLNNALPEAEACGYMDDYIKCMMDQLNLTAPLSDENITVLEAAVNENLALADSECEVNVASLVTKLRRAPGKRRPRQAAGYEAAQTLPECTHTLREQITQFGDLQCFQLAHFFKCAFRVTGFYKLQLTGREHLAIEHQIKTLLHRLQIMCTFDTRAILEDLAREEKLGNRL
ncbi:hypothetical protein BsWGS_09429 [Bradybaena similaris]